MEGVSSPARPELYAPPRPTGPRPPLFFGSSEVTEASPDSRAEDRACFLVGGSARSLCGRAGVCVCVWGRVAAAALGTHDQPPWRVAIDLSKDDPVCSALGWVGGEKGSGVANSGIPGICAQLGDGGKGQGRGSVQRRWGAPLPDGVQLGRTRSWKQREEAMGDLTGRSSRGQWRQKPVAGARGEKVEASELPLWPSGQEPDWYP